LRRTIGLLNCFQRYAAEVADYIVPVTVNHSLIGNCSLFVAILVCARHCHGLWPSFLWPSLYKLVSFQLASASMTLSDYEQMIIYGNIAGTRGFCALFGHIVAS